MSQLHNHKHRSQTKMIPHFQRIIKKEISDGSEQISISLTDATTLLGKTYGLLALN
ncbi:hypothetical protein Gotri_005684 [Gossypium trilobum]|uniref:Uncharacterized protein n=1 Tax=Gossypium trilobum TaxID=34281 RepID=A0A7J9EYB3_9ROSI|nr:hypothetical protein [Gossypium trilobum]